ncbi:MAG: TRAP transporter small permease [Synergistaceae bacterium]|jgi:TRAP-type C4-dicarboxylate transport system permease small subunit|nr:TRAP transporter small permease [Synergistaceae bacterium]
MKNSKIVRLSVGLLRFVVGVMFVGVVILTLAQVFFRFVLASPLVWSEELARFMLVWMTMLGTPILCYENSHLAITEFAASLPPALQTVVRVTADIIVLVLFGAILCASPKLLRASAHIESGALGIPFVWWRIAAPAGCLLMAFYTICNIQENIRAFLRGASQKSGEIEEKEALS